MKGLKASVAHTFTLSIFIAILLTMVSVFATKPLLVLLQTPDPELSYRYISVVLFAVSVTVFYNILAGIMRAVGNSLAPLVFLIIGALCNIGLDCFFICVLDLGVFGAGLATVLSQVISCILSAVYLWKKCRKSLTFSISLV